MMRIFCPIALAVLVACGGSAQEVDGQAGQSRSPGTFSLTLQSMTGEAGISGDASFRPLDRFVDSTYRHTIDLDLGDEGDLVINVIVERSEENQIVPTGGYDTGQFGPGGTAPIAELYILRSPTISSNANNPGEVTISSADEEQVQGTFDVSIPDRTTGNFVRVTGSFNAIAQ